MDCIVAPLYVTSDVFLRANTPIIFKAGEPNHITIKTKNINKDDHTGILLGGHPGDGLPRYIGVLLEGTMNIVAPFNSESATKVLEQLGIDFKNEAFTITQEETKLAPGRPLLGRALQREIAADDGNITIAIHVKRKIKAASTSATKVTPTTTPITAKPPTPGQTTVQTPTSILITDTLSTTGTLTSTIKLATNNSILSDNVYYLSKLDDGTFKLWDKQTPPIVPTEAKPYVFKDYMNPSSLTPKPLEVYSNGLIELEVVLDNNNYPQNTDNIIKKGTEIRLQFDKRDPPRPVWGNGPGGFKIGTLEQDYNILDTKSKISVNIEENDNQVPTQDQRLFQESLNDLLALEIEQVKANRFETAKALIYYMFSALRKLSETNNNYDQLIQLRTILKNALNNPSTLNENSFNGIDSDILDSKPELIRNGDDIEIKVLTFFSELKALAEKKKDELSSQKNFKKYIFLSETAKSLNTNLKLKLNLPPQGFYKQKTADDIIAEIKKLNS